MSDTPKLADECKRLLDNGWTIQLFRNDLGSYTAAAIPPALMRAIEGQGPFDDDDIEPHPDKYVTDDFEPSQALYRLTEKVFGNIV